MAFSALLVVVVTSFVVGEPLISSSLVLARTAQKGSKQPLTSSPVAKPQTVCRNGQVYMCKWNDEKAEKPGNKRYCNALCKADPVKCAKMCSCSCQKVTCKANQECCYGILTYNGEISKEYKSMCQCKMVSECKEVDECTSVALP